MSTIEYLLTFQKCPNVDLPMADYRGFIGTFIDLLAANRADEWHSWFIHERPKPNKEVRGDLRHLLS